jgi:dihydrofolate synthase/folylpolyglutamate synthase
MIYQEAIDFLFGALPMYQRQGSAAYKSNLDNTHQLDEYFSHPHQHFPCIHVAGTNGKGSVSHMLASVLQASGLRTGLYTSPHLLDFRERIKIDGQLIPREEVTRFVTEHRSIIDTLRPSFFEMTVAMAFDYFAREHVEVAVIETGMGGRLDSTNIITPVLSIITNISKDHTAFLGSEITSIAREKGGIIKAGVPL